jgi:hypothetical protein
VEQPSEAELYRRRIENYFSIVNENNEAVPFTLRKPQLKILEKLTRRDIILKARQEGISSLILAMFAIDFLFIENIRCVVISHEKDATSRLLSRVKFYLDSIKKRHPELDAFKLRTDTKYELVNEYKNSVFYIGTAGARAFGRGDTIFNLHASELSRWPDQEGLMTGLLQAVPLGGRVIIETTANGVGDYFHTLWKKSNSNQMTFKPHFLSWFDDPKYTLPIFGEFQAYQDHDTYGNEVELQKVFHLTNEQLNWRRYKIDELSGNIDQFNQEFPATPEEAFIVSGNPIWSPSLLKKYLLRCHKPKYIGNIIGAYEVFFEENEKGYLKVWKKPIPGHTYVIGGDVAEGIEVPVDGPKSEKRDYSCAYVMDRNTAELVASWHGHIDGDQFGRQLEAIGRWYNLAFIGVERNFQGLAPLMTLRDLNYPRIYYRERIGQQGDPLTAEMGWKTTRETRPLMIDEGSKWLREERINIYDSELIGEMMSFVRYPDGQGRAASNSFDDRVISFLITIQMYIRNPMTEIGNPIERPDSMMDQNEGLPIDLDLGGSEQMMEM